MILRRFMKHVSDQNWFAVGLDVLVVIVGIFLGMQVTEWNEDRKDTADEAAFLQALHDDIVLAESASGRVFKRRLSSYDDLKTATRVLFSNDSDRKLDEVECTAIGNSNILNIVVGELLSLTELQASGRIGIIRNPELRRAAIALQQRILSQKEVMSQMMNATHDVLLLYPDILQVSSTFDPELNEINLSTQCDLDSMRSRADFINSISTNMDIFDAYLRDGLRPWKAALDHLHQITDEQLGLAHPKTQDGSQ